MQSTFISSPRDHGPSAELNAVEWWRNLTKALEQTADTVMITNYRGAVEYVNPAFEKLTGFSRQEMLGSKPDILRSDRHSASFYRDLWRTTSRGEVFSDVFVNRNKSGTLYYEEKTITLVKDRCGKVTHFIATGKDITEQVQTRERLQRMAQYDPLTDLPNRPLLRDRLTRALARAGSNHHCLAVLFLNIDRFKVINDTLGHDAGDRLLQGFAQRLRGGVRDGDTVARLGGDEFIVLLDDIAVLSDVTRIAGKVFDALSAPFIVDDREMVATVSMGIGTFPTDGQDPQVLLHKADVAMRYAKKRGGNRYELFTCASDVGTTGRLALEADLRDAFDKEEFVLYYQPQFDLRSRQIVGVEALVRWRHGERGLIPPDQFVPLMEENGLIVALGEWVLRRACRQAKQWQEVGYPPCPVAVNLSPRQFAQPDLVDKIEEILTETGLDPQWLELELTESVLVEDVKRAGTMLTGLSELGIRLSMDDFGTGYSSLSYLKRLPFDTLKIDRSFVGDVTNDADGAAIVSAIIGLAELLGLRVIAEGVETVEQAGFLRARGCRFSQGFLYSKPVPPQALEGLFGRGSRIGSM